MGKAVLVVGAIVLGVLMLGARDGGNQPAAQFVAMDERASCTARGVAYFKEIGSWPTLSSGADAFNAAYERCQRSVMAF
jgi:hypothetical protein